MWSGSVGNERWVWSHKGHTYVSFQQISADPADINVLPEYKNDPRVVSNLIDGVNKTRQVLTEKVLIAHSLCLPEMTSICGWPRTLLEGIT